MKETHKIIIRGSVTYVLYAEKVVVGYGLGQWTSYNQYDNWNRQGISRFRKALLKSREDQYGSPTEQLTLAHECGIVGTGSSKPKELQ